jgi:beta-phosphoglucomutase
MSNSPFAVIFDKDGVITDNNEFHKEAWFVFNKKYGRTINVDEFKASVFGKTNEEILRVLFPARFTDAEIDALAEEKEAIFRELYAPHFKLTQGLAAFFERLKAAQVPIGLATNAPLSNMQFTLEKGNIDHYFAAKANPLLVEKPKPAPDIYIKVASMLGYPTSKCIIFEDSLTGIQAGRLSGAKVIAITTTYTRQELELVADRVIDNFDEVEIPDLMALLSL